MPPGLCKASDAADAEAICEAVAPLGSGETVKRLLLGFEANAGAVFLLGLLTKAGVGDGGFHGVSSLFCNSASGVVVLQSLGFQGQGRFCLFSSRSGD